MGREVRRVAANWEHPKEYNYYRNTREYKPLYPGNHYRESFTKWIEGKQRWDGGQV